MGEMGPRPHFYQTSVYFLFSPQKLKKKKKRPDELSSPRTVCGLPGRRGRGPRGHPRTQGPFPPQPASFHLSLIFCKTLCVNIASFKFFKNYK